MPLKKAVLNQRENTTMASKVKRPNNNKSTTESKLVNNRLKGNK